MSSLLSTATPAPGCWPWEGEGSTKTSVPKRAGQPSVSHPDNRQGVLPGTRRAVKDGGARLSPKDILQGQPTVTVSAPKALG